VAIAAHFTASSQVVDAVLDDPSRLSPRRQPAPSTAATRPRGIRTAKESTA